MSKNLERLVNCCKLVFAEPQFLFSFLFQSRFSWKLSINRRVLVGPIFAFGSYYPVMIVQKWQKRPKMRTLISFKMVFLFLTHSIPFIWGVIETLEYFLKFFCSPEKTVQILLQMHMKSLHLRKQVLHHTLLIFFPIRSEITFVPTF